ncbi:MAG: HAMP domain-containing sensor histidine kinase [Synechococcus sp. ELA057]
MKAAASAVVRRSRSRSPASLEAWLRSATALAVLSGYLVLVLLTIGINRTNRTQEHQQLRDQIAQLLRQRSTSPSAMRRPLEPLLLPGLEIQVLAAAPGRPVRLLHRHDRLVMESLTGLVLADGRPRSLLLRQDVTEAIANQTLSLQLLAIFAGCSALLTALLMRPLLVRGLVEPLQALSDQLAAFRSLDTPPEQLDVSAQPRELQPIAATFNAMALGLSSSWERQRQFVDTVAHELRTPITLISGHAQSLQRQANVTALRPTLGLISAEARRMAALVSDLLDLARKDAGRLELRRDPLDVENILLEVYERLAPAAAGRLRLEPPALDQPLPLVVGDHDRLAQCLLAVIDNALRYSPAAAEVRLLAAVVSGALIPSTGASTDAVVIHVIDRGPGVRPEERERIFERFIRGSAALDTRGSGIGLAVVKLLIESMGGWVQVEQACGTGADFQLLLPLMRADQSTGSR